MWPWEWIFLAATSAFSRILMKTIFLCLALVSVGFGVPAMAQTVVTNVKSHQIPGTRRVEITYDVAAGSSCTTALQASLDGGATYAVVLPPGSIGSDSDLGPGMSGSNRSIELDASKVPAFEGLFTKQLRFKILVTAVTTFGDMVLIPGGSFQMGDQSNPRVGDSDELPVHTVVVSAFYMAKYETTKELWDSVRAWGMSNGHGYTDLAVGNGSYASKGANHPVHSVTWYDMVKWCNARSEMENLVPCYTVSGATYKTGQNDAVACNWSANGYRLPTEAEWEKAARGGQTGKNFPWGDTIGHSKANYRSYTYSYEDDPKNQGYHPDYTAGGYPYSAPVDSFAPNGYGLYNMAGSMWEWCWDRYGGYVAGSQDDPRGAPSGSYRVLRGGSWNDYANYCRVAYRNYGYPGSSRSIGFRSARSSVP